jgi:hypothetical protein
MAGSRASLTCADSGRLLLGEAGKHLVGSLAEAGLPGHADGIAGELDHGSGVGSWRSPAPVIHDLPVACRQRTAQAVQLVG